MTAGLSQTQIALLFLHVALLISLARLLGELLKRAGQPAVLGELLAGIFLGPSVLGRWAPQASALIFPPDAGWALPLETLSWFGLALLMLFTGLETDVRLLRSLGRPAFLASAFGLVVPFAAGLGMGIYLPDSFVPSTSTRLLTSLFLATALTVSALPVIARILIDLGLVRRNVGVVTLTAAVVDDTLGWIALALIAGMAGMGGFRIEVLLRTLGLLAAFLLACRFAAYPVLRRLLRKSNAAPGRDVVVIAAFCFLCAAASEAIGVHAVFGAFVAGAVLRQCPSLSPDTLHRIEALTLSVFAPLFFASVGLKVDFERVESVSWTAIILGVAVLSKVAGCAAGGLLAKLSFVESLTLGLGMNARGAMGLVVALVGVNLKVIGPDMFAIIVLMAIVTSFMAPLTIRPLIGLLPVTPEEKAREAPATSRFLPKGRLRILVPTGGGLNALLGCHIAAVIAGDEGDSVTAFYVETGRRRWWQALAFWRRRPRLDVEGLVAEIRSTPGASEGSLHLQKARAVGSVTETLLEEARKGYDLLFLGASEKSHPVYDPFVASIIRANPCHLIVVRRPREAAPAPPLRHLLVPVNGSYPSDAAVQFAADYATRVKAKVTVLYVIQSQHRNPLLPAAGLDPSDAQGQERMLRSLREQFAGRAPAELLEVKVREAASVGAAVAEEAAQGADLVVLGAENKSIVERVYLGQNIEALLDSLPCAVALVLPKVAGR